MDNKVSLEAMLHLAAVELDELEYYEFKELEKKNKLAEPRDEFTLKMQSVLDKEKRVDKFLKLGKKLSKVAAVFMISFSLLSMSFLSVGAVRKSVSDVILEWYDGFTKILIVDEIVPTTIGDVEFGFVPAGFKMVSLNDELQYFKRYYFENTDGLFFHVRISLSNEEAGISMDNDTLQYHSIIIDDMKGIWLEEEGFNTIIISRDGITYTINGIITLENIIKIYKSIIIL